MREFGPKEIMHRTLCESNCENSFPFLSDTATPNSTWLAGLSLSSFLGPSLPEQIAQAAGSLGVHILSPDSSRLTEDFTTKEMVDEAHRLGVMVKPWTVRIFSTVLGIDFQQTDVILCRSIA